jgi:tRNA U34 5-methylaminomethyl-2-thiouridine-forming methyltransferase MnmC
MPHQRETIPIDGAELLIQVTDDDSRTLIRADSNVAYHSASGAASETSHVYLGNSAVGNRLQAGKPTAVLEIGFGTGLGLLMTLDAAFAAGTPLRYESVEYELLSPEILSRLQLGRFLRHPQLVDALLGWLDSLGPRVPAGRYRWQAGDRQTLWLIHGDVREIDFSNTQPVDAIYFDPFAPSENPDLWKPDFLKLMRSLLNTDGRLVTYAVSREVRNSFAKAGFQVQRVSGPPGGKREVLIARVPASQTV